MATSLADTSKTYGSTVLDVTDAIEHATRRCGVPPAVLTSEQLSSARTNLFLILSNLATKGLSLWCVSEFLIDLPANQRSVELPVGTIDVLDPMFRAATRTAATFTGSGIARVDAGADVSITGALAGLPTPGRYDLQLESSPDNATWTVRGAESVFYSGGNRLGIDATTFASARHWRIRDVYDPTRVFTSGTFLSAPTDTPITKQSRTDYAQLPNKAQFSDRPSQFWYDKQFYRPRMVMWPVQQVDAALKIYAQRQVQDPGAFTNAVEVPQRWLDAIYSLLAVRVCLELPTQLVPEGRLERLQAIADRALADAEDSEVDGAPMTLAVNIAPYTS